MPLESKKTAVHKNNEKFNRTFDEFYFVNFINMLYIKMFSIFLVKLKKIFLKEREYDFSNR